MLWKKNTLASELDFILGHTVRVTSEDNTFSVMGILERGPEQYFVESEGGKVTFYSHQVVRLSLSGVKMIMVKTAPTSTFDPLLDPIVACTMGS